MLGSKYGIVNKHVVAEVHSNRENLHPVQTAKGSIPHPHLIESIYRCRYGAYAHVM
jgi:hypothetical protein